MCDLNVGAERETWGRLRDGTKDELVRTGGWYRRGVS